MTIPASVGAMKPFRVWAIARKESIHILGDPSRVGMAIAMLWLAAS